MEFAPESNRVVHIKVLSLGMPKWEIAIHGNSNRTDPVGRRNCARKRKRDSLSKSSADEPVEA